MHVKGTVANTRNTIAISALQWMGHLGSSSWDAERFAQNKLVFPSVCPASEQIKILQLKYLTPSGDQQVEASFDTNRALVHYEAPASCNKHSVSLPCRLV